MSLLSLEALSAGYARAPVLHQIDAHVDKGEIVTLIGRNGSGRTTLLRTILGFTTVNDGDIRLNGRSIVGKPPYAVARAGVRYIAESRGMFATLTVEETLRLAGRRLSNERADLLEMFPILRERMKQRASSLSGGEKQQLALARALWSDPSLILIDELSEGLQPNLVQELARRLRAVAAGGTALLVVEQNVRLALAMSDRAYVLEKGRLVDSGDSAQFSQEEDRMRKYLVV